MVPQVASPELLPEANWLWEAFMTLTNQRMFGHTGPQPLAIADMYAYARAHEYSPPDMRWMIEVIGKMDRVYIEEMYADIAKQQKKQEQKIERKRGSRGR